jgi:hypothetical protein
VEATGFARMVRLIAFRRRALAFISEEARKWAMARSAFSLGRPYCRRARSMIAAR